MILSPGREIGYTIGFPGSGTEREGRARALPSETGNEVSDTVFLGFPVMIIGGIWLIYKQKIYIDRETKQVTEIGTPLGNFKTNAPALMLFGLGFVPLIYPMFQLAGDVREVSIRGTLQTDSPVDVYAVIATDSLPSGGRFYVNLPVVKNAQQCRLVYVSGGVIRSFDVVHIARQDTVELTGKVIQQQARTPVQTLRPVPAEFAHPQ